MSKIQQAKAYAGKATNAVRQERFRQRRDHLVSAVDTFREAFEASIDRANSRSISRIVRGLDPDDKTKFLEGLAAALEGLTLVPYRNKPEGEEKARKPKVSKEAYVLSVYRALNRMNRLDWFAQLTAEQLRLGHRLAPKDPGRFVSAWTASENIHELKEALEKVDDGD